MKSTRLPPASPDWPVIKTYDCQHLDRIALPLGGIGAGTISLGGRGDLRDWEIMNRPAKGFIPPGNPFFALWAKPRSGPAIGRILEGPLPVDKIEGNSGATAPNHGMPRFRNCEFAAAYPFGQVLLSDPDVPLAVRLEAFNPLVPADADASGMPVVALRYVLINATGQPVEASVCGMLPNFIGNDGAVSVPSKGNHNEFRKGKGLHGIFLYSSELDPQQEQFGTIALSVLGQRDAAVSYRTAWAQKGWSGSGSALDFWEDWMADGRLDERARGEAADPRASLASRLTVPARSRKSVTFLITWHFPNRQIWAPPAPSAAISAAPHARTAFARSLLVSPLLPFDGDIEALAPPKDLALESRAFPGDFCDRHGEISAHESKDMVAYYQCPFECSEPMQLEMLLGYDGPVALWVDGQKLYADATGTNPAEPGETSVPFIAARGKHAVLVALGSNKGKAWGIFLQLERTDLTQRAKRDRAAPVTLPRLLAEPASACGCSCGEGTCKPEHSQTWVGNYYTTQFRDAWDAAVKTAARLPRLEADTLKFLRAFCASDLPLDVKDAALATLTALRSQTTFRTADGFPFGWEGCGDHCGSCWGSCTHVWNYENAVGFLFGDFSRLMRRVEFEHATGANGLMSFRVGLPLKNAKDWPKAAADGQMGAIMRCYRDWRLSGDEDFVKAVYPQLRKALEFCWVEGGWDADKDGVMEGCQHNTMDVEYYGPNPQMGIWYLGALRAGEEMARHVGDLEFAKTCRGLFERGRTWIDKNLFNGEYYEHQIRPPKGQVAAGLQIGMGGKVGAEPDCQLGPGCLVDQLVGQYMAHAVGLGYLVDPAHARTTLRSIMRHNFKTVFWGHFNPMRSYALGDESALLMATYPRGNRPKIPFPYFTEVMTGFEYTAAVGMLYEGLTADGLKCISAIRERYDGNKRSPFNEAECGHHYARAMASWTAVLALTGFQYDGVTGTIEFAAAKKPTAWFWSSGGAWGTVKQTPGRRALRVELRVLHGALSLRHLVLKGWGAIDLPGKKVAAGKPLILACVKNTAQKF
jgi:uncharacterized protein (DUF608 family)